METWATDSMMFIFSQRLGLFIIPDSRCDIKLAVYVLNGFFVKYWVKRNQELEIFHQQIIHDICKLSAFKRLSSILQYWNILASFNPSNKIYFLLIYDMQLTSIDDNIYDKGCGHFECK